MYSPRECITHKCLHVVDNDSVITAGKMPPHPPSERTLTGTVVARSVIDSSCAACVTCTRLISVHEGRGTRSCGGIFRTNQCIKHKPFTGREIIVVPDLCLLQPLVMFAFYSVFNVLL